MAASVGVVGPVQGDGQSIIKVSFDSDFLLWWDGDIRFISSAKMRQTSEFAVKHHAEYNQHPCTRKHC